MKKTYYILSTLILSIFAILWNGVIHLVILKNANAAIQAIHRPDMSDKMWISILVTVLLTLIFITGYAAYRKNGTVKEALLYSIYFTCIIGVIVDLNQYVMYAIPFSLIVKWFVFGSVEFFIYGQITRVLAGTLK